MYDLIIIGAGPAGLTCGLYAGRFRLHSLVLEKTGAGGQIVSSPTIENFPGFPGGIATQDLIERFKKQVEEVGIGIQLEEVTEIMPIRKNDAVSYVIKTGENNYETKMVIIATGAQPKKLGVKGEDRLIGRGVSYCGTCDAPLFRNKDIAIVGGGDRAIEEAIFLTSYASRVSVIHRRQELRASKILEEKARSNGKIEFIFDSVVEEISGEKKVESVRIRNLKSSAASDLACQGIFIFVGIKPNTEFVKNLLKLNELGFIITGRGLETSQPGIFACGDCCERSLYQVINACGDAAVSVDSVHKYLLISKG